MHHVGNVFIKVTIVSWYLAPWCSPLASFRSRLRMLDIHEDRFVCVCLFGCVYRKPPIPTAPHTHTHPTEHHTCISYARTCRNGMSAKTTFVMCPVQSTLAGNRMLAKIGQFSLLLQRCKLCDCLRKLLFGYEIQNASNNRKAGCY